MPSDHRVLAGAGPAEPLQRQLADQLDPHEVLHRGVDPLAHQDLAVLGLVAQARGQVDHAADRPVVEAALEPDIPQRGVARGDPDLDAELVAAAAPPALRSAIRP